MYEGWECKVCSKSHGTLEAPALAIEKTDRGKDSVSWDLYQLFQTPRISDPSSISLGILIFQNKAHHHHCLSVLFLMESSDDRSLWQHCGGWNAGVGDKGEQARKRCSSQGEDADVRRRQRDGKERRD